jgi:hypothetical protein
MLKKHTMYKTKCICCVFFFPDCGGGVCCFSVTDGTYPVGGYGHYFFLVLFVILCAWKKHRTFQPLLNKVEKVQFVGRTL